MSDGEVSVSYPINSIQSISWIGDEPCSIGAVKWSQDRATLECDTCSWSVPDATEPCETVYGVISIQYTSRFEIYVCNTPDVGKLVVYAYANEK